MEIKEKVKQLNYEAGVLKRKLGIKASEKVEPGTLINKAKSIKNMSPRKRTAFMGMI